MATIKVFGGNDGWIYKEVSDDMAKLVKLFNEIYAYLYMHDGDDKRPFGYYPALNYGDMLIRQHHPLVAEFNSAREEPMLSDREVVALATAAANLNMV